MKKTLPLLATIAALLAGCATLPPSTLMPQGKNENLLPPLTPVVDIQSFGSVFGISSTEGTHSGAAYNVGYGVVVGSGTSNSMTYSSVALNEINTIFGRDIENISVPIYSEKAKGTIIARLVVGETIKYHLWPSFLSGLTLCVFNLLGAPFDYATTGLQIEVTILNDKSGIVGKYVSAYHEQTSFYAMYWGYSADNAPKRNTRLVFAECMKDIKQQIANDYDRLNAALN